MVSQYLVIYKAESDAEWEGEERAAAQLRHQQDVSEW